MAMLKTATVTLFNLLVINQVVVVSTVQSCYKYTETEYVDVDTGNRNIETCFDNDGCYVSSRNKLRIFYKSIETEFFFQNKV